MSADHRDRGGGRGNVVSMNEGSSNSSSNSSSNVPGILPDTVDPVSFRVPATDGKGHAVRLFCRAQPGHANQVAIILQSRKFPYRTKGDIMRHALVRHLRWLETLEPIRSVTAEVDAIMEIMKEEEFNHDFQVTFEKLQSVVANHISNNAQNEAIRLVLQVRLHLEAMPEGYWRTKYLTEIDQRYGHIIQRAHKPSLSSFTQE